MKQRSVMDRMEENMIETVTVERQTLEDILHGLSKGVGHLEENKPVLAFINLEPLIERLSYILHEKQKQD